jgi:hypothetical protein
MKRLTTLLNTKGNHEAFLWVLIDLIIYNILLSVTPSGGMGEEGGERGEEEGDGGAECGVMKSSVDSSLQEAQFRPAQMEAMYAEKIRCIVPLHSLV